MEVLIHTCSYSSSHVRHTADFEWGAPASPWGPGTGLLWEGVLESMQQDRKSCMDTSMDPEPGQMCVTDLEQMFSEISISENYRFF